MTAFLFNLIHFNQKGFEQIHDNRWRKSISALSLSAHQRKKIGNLCFFFLTQADDRQYVYIIKNTVFQQKF